MKRRDFIKGAVATVPGTIALQALSSKWAWAQTGDFADDLDVLNYALLLEYLEAEFYRQGNENRLPEPGKERRYLRQIGTDEAIHVDLLTTTIRQLGGTPIAAPAVDFGAAVETRDAFLEAAFTFENLGVQAYLGAAGFIQNKDILQAAAGIFGVECRHAAIIGNLLDKPAEGGVYMGSFETPKPRAEVLAAATPFLR